MDGWEKKVGELARTQHGVVTRRQVLDAGANQDLIWGRIRRGTWLRVHREVYQVAPPADPWLSSLQALVLHSGGIAWGRSAARLYAMDAFDRDPALELRSPRDVRHPGALIHRRPPLPRRLLSGRQGIPAPQPPLVLLHLGASAPRNDLECALDFCLRRRWTSFKDLARLCRQHAGNGLRGPALLQELLDLRAPEGAHTDSIVETRCLQIIRDRGLPAPSLTFRIRSNGRIVARPDLAYPERRLLIELLGYEFHGKERWQLTHDCRRSNAIELLEHFRVLRFTADEVFQNPTYVGDTVSLALGVPLQRPLPLPPPYSPRYALRTSGLANSSFPVPAMEISPVSST